MNTMKIRALDPVDDWMFGRGLQSFQFGQAAIVENIETRLLSFLNDCFWNLPFGVDWWNLIGAKNPAAQQQILLQTRTMIAGSFGVTKINSVAATINTRTRALSISYNVDTIFTSGATGSVQPTP